MLTRDITQYTMYMYMYIQAPLHSLVTSCHHTHLLLVLREDCGQDDLVLRVHHHLTKLWRTPSGRVDTPRGRFPLTATSGGLMSAPMSIYVVALEH